MENIHGEINSGKHNFPIRLKISVRYEPGPRSGVCGNTVHGMLQRFDLDSIYNHSINCRRCHVKCGNRSDVKELDEATTLDECRSFVDLCLNNVARLHSAAVTCKVMGELNISSPPSDWVRVKTF